MNRSELRSQVEENIGRTDKTSQINSALDQAVRKVSADHLWSDLLVEATATFTIGNNQLALASDTRRLIEIRVIDGLSSYSIQLRPKTWIIFRWPDPLSEASRKPAFGYLQGTTLFVVPPPDLAYEVRYSYFRIHPRLTDETSELLILQADEAVIAYATYRVFKSLQQHEEAAQWLADYVSLVGDAKLLDRSSAVKHIATPRGQGRPVRDEYWLDPFVYAPPVGGIYHGGVYHGGDW